MAEKVKIFIDTSYLKAFVDPNDDFHADSLTIREKLISTQAQLITSNFILDESFTLIRKRCGMEYVTTLREALIDDVIKIFRVTSADEGNAWEWFVKNWSDLSFTDCVSFAMMERLGLARVATFDKDFAKGGFSIEK